MITRCPGCQTLFKVVPDQLRISEGWVRCGQCDAIFDASLHLVPQAPDALPQNADSAPPSTPVDGGTATPELASAQPEPMIPTEPDSNEDQGPALQSTTESGEVSFLRKPRQDTLWHKPLVRVALALLSLTLLLTLAGQIVFHERDRIAAQQPDLKPWLLAFCEAFNCQLSALRQKDSVLIDSASFTKLREDAYRLNFTLKNTAAVALALPAIELTLTDSRDQPVLRRVLRATELGVGSDSLAAASERPISLALAVNVPATAERIVGYRVYAFYP
ncbi:MAG: zinc-ribbon and DUF3426 domain-containing protein [Rhodoferax sp.]|uniref:zinc-ribbon and DUF3426 domain-containing protein n=1 Tax=Rhodoferax sp. TaxID=50421 RepID=UPI00262CAB25|nr:zinc-ribbon and DUF3426 domain-containing protein [Rhodoferax sp.]MDD5333710.1 zinc-ribbon and DUF3426 domain-containing protein [Rhodoferax sp.]